MRDRIYQCSKCARVVAEGQVEDAWTCPACGHSRMIRVCRRQAAKFQKEARRHGL